MNPAPLCKTAIVSFIIHKAFKPLWNVSSGMRKRMKAITKDREIEVKKYSEGVLKINERVRIAEEDKFVRGTDDVKKGISNYGFRTKEQVKKVISLNGKLRCHSLYYDPEIPYKIESIESLRITPSNYCVTIT